MKTRFSGTIRLALFLILGILLIWLSFRNIDFRKVSSGLREANYIWLLLSFTFSFLSFFSRARRWILLIKPLGYTPSFWNAYHSLLSGYLANIALPRLGEFTRAVALGRKEAIPVQKIVGTVVIERAVDLVTLFLITSAVILFGPAPFREFINELLHRIYGNISVSISEKSSFFWFMAAAIAILIPLLIYFFRKQIGKVRLLRKAGAILREIWYGLKSAWYLKDRGEFLLHTIIIWTCYLFMTWVVFFAIPSTSGLNLGDGLFLLVIGSMAMAAPVQSGFGAFHWVISRGLNVIFGIDLTDGLVYATLSHESQILLLLVAGTISTVIIYSGNKKKALPEEQ